MSQEAVRPRFVGKPKTALRRIQLSRVYPWLVTAGLLLAVGLPVVMVLLQGFDVSGRHSELQQGHGVQLGLYYWKDVWHTPGIWKAIENTVTITIIRITIAMIVGIFLAWLIARTDIPGRGALEFAFWVAFFMPSLAIMQGWLFLTGGPSGLFNVWLDKLPFIHGAVFNLYSYWGIIWVHLMGPNLSLTVILLIPVFRQMDSSLEEAAYVNGASKLRMLRSVFLPLMRPSVVFLLVLGIIKALQSYEVEQILGAPAKINVYATLLVQMVSSEPTLLGQGSALSSVILIVLLPLVILQRLMTRREYTTISSKMRVNLVHLGRWRIPAFAFCVLIVVLMTVVPFAATVAGSFMTRWGFFSIPHPWTFHNWHVALNDPDITKALWTTLKFGLLAGLIGGILMYIVAYLIVRGNFRGRPLLDFGSWLPWAVPGVLLSFGISTAILRVPWLRWLNGTSLIVVVALVIFAFPAGTQLLKTSIQQIGRELEESASTSGARWTTVQRKVVVPLLLPTLIGAALITFVGALSEVSGIILLAPTSTRTLSLVSLGYMQQSQYEVASVMNTILMLLAIGIALLARLFGIRLGAGDGGGQTLSRWRLPGRKPPARSTEPTAEPIVAPA